MVGNMNKQQTTNNIKISNKDTEILKKHFSHCFDKSGDFDFEKFKKELSKNEIDFSKESYGMDWLGKSYARLLASDETTTLLKEDKKFNKKQENKDSQNLLIKGDNLEVLKHLSNAYYEKVKMIYIDPPYNTGSDGFVYQDDRKFTVEELSSLAGIDEEKSKRILDFTQSKSNSHSAWLSFMYPRLYIAKQLLKDDGVIFISIDDNEVAQLRLVMDKIFGEENFVRNVIWEKKYSPSNDSKVISDTHDHILVYSKNINYWEMKLLPRTEEMNKRYSNTDNDKRGKWKAGGLSAKTYSINYDYSVKTPSGKIVNPPTGSCWQVSKEKLEILIKDNRIYFGKNGDAKPQIKQFLSEVQNGMVPKSIWKYDEVGHNQTSRKELTNLFNGVFLFDNPKPTKLIKRILNITSLNNNDLILDFFAGSGTTADAVMQLNTEDGGNRKYILVQLPEKIDKKKNKTAYDFVKDELKIENPTIFEITKERLKRAGKKIIKDNKNSKKPKDLSKQDFGFKIFETTPIWEDYNFEAEEFNPQTKLFDESKLNDEDIKTLLTTWKTYDGISLVQDLKEIDLDGYKGYYFDTKLYLMDKGFKTKNLKKLLTEIDENKDFNPATVIVFGYNFESKALREIAENVKNYANKKHIDVDFITRY
ncbi:MAG: site-specific DNA-methyltransferase [Candidatus Pacebacteria bacterium]|nr:site-specific DNA-methyltransferase [Candidatus Paceibacterota bacterium]